MKYLHSILGIICAVCIFIIVLWTSIELATYDKNFYMSQYDQNNVYDVVNISPDDLSLITLQIIKYLQLKTNDMNVYVTNIDNRLQVLDYSDLNSHMANSNVIPFFNEKELHHMVDVQNLFGLFKQIRIICVIIIALLFILYKTNILNRYTAKNFNGSKIMLVSTLITLVLLVISSIILVFVISSDFNRYFTIFHEIFFFNDLWQLNPATDRLINLVPLQFFINISIRIALYATAFIAIIIACIIYFGGIFFRRL